MFEHYGVVVTPADFIGADWIELCRRYGLKTLGLHSGGGLSHDVVEALGEYGGEACRRRIAAAGLEYEYECHAADVLMPRELFAEHPDFFVFDPRFQRRRPEGNWCPEHPEGRRVVMENTVRLARRLPSSTHRYLFWNADAPRLYCHCERCTSRSIPDQALAAVNTMARAVRSADPLGTVPYLAYYELLEAPVAVRPEENVFLEFAPITRCYGHAIDDPSCEINRRHWEALRRLLKVFPAATTHVLEYHLDSSLFSNWRRPAARPAVAPGVLPRDLAAYYGLGIRSLTNFAVFMDGDYFKRYGFGELAAYSEALHAFADHPEPAVR